MRRADPRVTHVPTRGGSRADEVHLRDRTHGTGETVRAPAKALWPGRDPVSPSVINKKREGDGPDGRPPGSGPRGAATVQ